MVSSNDIQVSNALVKDASNIRTAVFVGGTSGIGKATIRALIATGIVVRVYLVGRKSSENFSLAFIQEMSMLNPKAEIVWIEGEISLMKETNRVCEIIKSRESIVDLLFMTAGYAPFGTRQETSEGMEIAQSLEIYSRLLFIHQLRSLMAKSEAPRVVSVLGAGYESASIDLDDLDLEKPGNFGGVKAHLQYMSMTTMLLEKLADDNSNITFIHSCPGWVSTGNVRRGHDPNSIMSWIIWAFLEPMLNFFSISEEESGQRHLFQCTSAFYGDRGISWTHQPAVNSRQLEENGLFLVNYKCGNTTNAKTVTKLRDNAKQKIWDHTQEVLRSYM